MVPGAVLGYVANLTKVVTPEGRVQVDVEVRTPVARIVLRAGTVLQLPPGVPPTIYVSVLAEPPRAPNAAPVGPAVDLGPSGLRFSQPVVVEVQFDPAKVPPGTLVQLAYFDSDRGIWVTLPTLSVDPLTGAVRGITTHFTVFAAVAIQPTATVTSPVTVTQTETATVTEPVTRTVTETATRTVTTTTRETLTRTVTATQTATVTETRTTTTTVAAPPATVTSTVTATTTVPATVTVPKTPLWAYVSVAAVVVLAGIAAYLAVARRRPQEAAG